MQIVSVRAYKLTLLHKLKAQLLLKHLRFSVDTSEGNTKLEGTLAGGEWLRVITSSFALMASFVDTIRSLNPSVILKPSRLYITPDGPRFGTVDRRWVA